VHVTLATDGEARALTVGGDPASVHLGAAGQQNVDGVTVDVWQASTPASPGLTSNTVTLADLVKLAGGRLPVGLAAARTPGPFGVQWSATTTYTALSHDASLVRADATSTRVATLTGGGLTGTKTVSVGALGADWSTSAADDQAVVNQISHAAQDRADSMLWKAWLPAVLVLGALIPVISIIRTAESGKERKSTDHARTQRTQAEVL
jgi:high-affinity iron transporter